MRQLLAFGLTSIGVMVTASVAAQEASDVADLLSENIVTTPSKGLETASHSAATVSVITAEDMHKYGVRSLDEALNYLTHSIVVTDPAHAKEAGARGVLLTGDFNNHILVLLNGHVLNEPWDGSAYVDSGLGVPFELIDHIEVTLGPGSVMYGFRSNAGRYQHRHAKSECISWGKCSNRTGPCGSDRKKWQPHLVGVLRSWDAVWVWLRSRTDSSG